MKSAFPDVKTKYWKTNPQLSMPRTTIRPYFQRHPVLPGETGGFVLALFLVVLSANFVFGQVDLTRALIADLADHGKSATRAANFTHLKTLVRDLVIAEIDRKPDIADADLRATLAS